MKLTVLGSGPGGYVAALKAARLGAQVTVVEDDEVGGTCLNWGCIPTKTIIASTDLLAKMKESEKYGIQMNGSPVPNLAKIMERKNQVVGIQVKGIKALFKSWGIELKKGRGALVSPREIEVRSKEGDVEKIESDRIIVATGSRPAAIPTLPFDGRSVISSNEAITLSEIPKSILIVGAGVIGCEFACIYRELGSEVTVVEMLDRALAAEDREVSDFIEREFKKKKITLITKSGVDKISTEAGGVRAFLPGGKDIFTEKVLVSVGRRLNSTDIGLEALGVDKGKKGEIIVNSRMETNIPGIYAVGDVTGITMLAHVASRQGIVAAMNCAGLDEHIDYNVVPAAIFTSPEIASVGLTEEAALGKGMKIRTGRFQFRALGKAHAIGEISGFIKIISEEGTDLIVGAHIAGPDASDLIHEIAVAMKSRLTSRAVAETIHAHPTLSEGVMEAAEDVNGEAIHVPRK